MCKTNQWMIIYSWFILLFKHPLVFLFLYSVTHSSIHSVTQSLVCSIIQSFIPCFSHSFTHHSFIYLSIHPLTPHSALY